MHELDITDRKIIQELGKDGRIPIRHLAARIGVCERVARNRLHRMTSEGVIKVVAVRVFPPGGVTYPVFMGLNVQPGYSVDAVAESVAAYPNFGVVALATGPYDIITWALFDGLEALSVFLKNELGNISGIANSHTLIQLETVKNVLTYLRDEDSADKAEPPVRDRKTALSYVPDKLDSLIIQELQKDGRLTAVEIAKKLGISRINAAKRLRQLLSTGIIEVIAVTQAESLGYTVSGRIGVNVVPGTVNDVAHELAALDAVHFVAITVGHYDLLIGVHFSELRELSDFIRSCRNGIPAIAKTESMVYLHVVKSPFELVAALNQHS